MNIDVVFKSEVDFFEEGNSFPKEFYSVAISKLEWNDRDKI